MAAAQSNSEEKLFSKKLKVTDIEKRLAIPTKILCSLPSFNGDRAVHIRLVCGTKTWPIVCTVRRQGYSKPVFSGGWRKFVTANKLNFGDTITMYKVQDEDGTSSHYRVEMEQPATSNQGGALEHGVHETEFGNEQEKLSEVAEESIKQEGVNVAVDPQVDDVHVTTNLPPAKIFGTNTLVDDVHLTTKLPPVKVFGTDMSDEANIKCFGGNMKDIDTGKAEPPLVSSYMAKKGSEINFFGLAAETMAYGYRHDTIDQLAAAGEAWCSTVND